MGNERRRSPITILILLAIALAIIVTVVDRAAVALAHHAAAAHSAPLKRALLPYFELRARVAALWPLLLFAAIALAVGVFIALKRLAAWSHRLRARMAGLEMKKGEGLSTLKRVDFSLLQVIEQNPNPSSQVVLGVDDKAQPVYLTDRARSMHLHVLGQTGSGKTKSVIEPLLFQDLCRRRGVCFVDGKGSQDNEERLLAMAALAGRLAEVKILTLNPTRWTHTMNPVHVGRGGDPRAIAERVFSTFAADMDNPYYRNQARKLFVNLVQALAGTAKPFSMLDIDAAVASEEILRHALSLSSDAKAKAEILAQIEELGVDAGPTFTGLRASLAYYDHPAINAYNPDIILEDEFDRGGIVGFFLPTNYYKQLARYLGICVLQHIQQVGAIRQLDRSRSQSPVYVYADEFYSFAYEGFTDSLNKSRDANISFLLSHQSFSDLEKVQPNGDAFAKGVWDNTRNKVVLYQNDPELCERIAKALGTVGEIKRTARESVDGFLNPYSTLEASAREVESYRLHPNRIKSLEVGQAYLVQDAAFAGTNLRTIPDSVFERLQRTRLPRSARAEVEGLDLHKLFVARAQARTASTKPDENATIPQQPPTMKMG